MIGTIVVPLDRSPVAERALPFAESVAKQIGARIVLLSVVDLPLEFQAWLESASVVDVQINAEKEFKDYLESVAPRSDGVQVDTTVRVGTAASEIQRFVESLQDVAVIMASHGRTGFRHVITGSVTQQVVHRLKTPMIIVPSSTPDPPSDTQSGILRRILVPLDGSPFAEHALRTGLEVFGATRPELLLVRVVEVVNWYGGVYSPADFHGLDPYIETTRDSAEAYLLDISAQLADDGFTVFSEVRVGRVEDEINSVARENDVDLILMATHGRSGAGRLIFGSVAERALRESPVPLMLVRPDESAIMEAKRSVVARASVNTELPDNRRRHLAPKARP